MRIAHRFVVGLIIAGLVSACSTSGSTPADAGPSSTVKCGAGGLTGTLRIADETSLGSVAGATFTAAGCNTGTADDTGTLQADLELGKPIKLRVTATGYVPGHGEVTPQEGGFYTTVYLLPESQKASVLTGWTGGSGYAIVSVANNGTDAGACATTDGLVVSVKGHPEVQVGYLSGPTTRSSTLTAMDVLGLAAVGPMPPGTYEFDAVKTGCTAGPDHGKFFLWPQSMDVEADTLSFVQLKLP